tara:strand:+ start:514 stop:2292 length:1779 start_codon:yes stop_codon:yes gene_type:complete
MIHELKIGEEQSGKSRSTVALAWENMQKLKEIPIFFAFATKQMEDSLNFHLHNKFTDAMILEGLAGIRKFKSLLEQGNQSILNDGKVVLSCIGRYDALEEILQIVNLTDPHHPYKFGVYIDEADTYGIDHDQCISEVKKDNILNSIAEGRKVARVIEITATPMSQTVSNSTYTDISTITPAENYLGFDNFKYNTVPSHDLLTLKSVSKKGIPDKIKKWIDTGLSSIGKVNLIAIVDKIRIQEDIALFVSKYIGEKAPVVVINSSNDKKCYIGGKNYPDIIVKNKIRETLDNCRVKGFENVFVIGQHCLSRSVTLEDSNKYYDACNILFHCSSTSSDPEILQRVGRICGYSSYNYPRVVTTDSTTQLAIIAARTNRNNLVEEVLTVALDAEERAAILRRYDKILKTNVFGKKNNNTQLTNVHSNKLTDIFDSKSSAEKAGYKVINFLQRYSLDNLSDEAKLQLFENRDCRPGTPLHTYIIDMTGGKNILKAFRPTSPYTNIPQHLPNIHQQKATKGSYHRDILYFYDVRKQELRISRQSREKCEFNYSIQDPITEKFECYSYVKKAGIRVTDKKTPVHRNIDKKLIEELQNAH